MTIPIYYDDPYLQEFDATVTRTDGEWVELDRTAFYPGGGGQSADRGTLGGLPVRDMRKSDGVMHLVPGHSLSVGDTAHGVVDWGRRYLLMRSHSGEHLLASVLESMLGIGIVKVSLTEERNTLFVDGELTWDVIAEAQTECNRIIAEDVPIVKTTVSRDDPSLGDVRIKLERIDGDSVRLVSISDVDTVACAGVHVGSTSEIGGLLVEGMTSGGQSSDFAIEFSIGERATTRAFGLALSAEAASDAMGAEVGDLVRTVTNLRHTAELRWSALKECNRTLLSSLEPVDVSGVRVHAGSFHGVDKKRLNAAAGDFREGGVAVLTSSDDRTMMVIACDPSLGIDAREMLSEALEPFGGRGGGREDFAAGGCVDPDAGKALVSRVLSLIAERSRD